MLNNLNDNSIAYRPGNVNFDWADMTILSVIVSSIISSDTEWHFARMKLVNIGTIVSN